MFSAGYLPAQHEATFVEIDKEQAIRNIRKRAADRSQRERLDFVRRIDTRFLSELGGSSAVEAAVENYETAYRMQSAVPELVDVTGETAATQRLYGLESPHEPTAAYGRQCLLARRLVERGVRFVELSCLGREPGGGPSGNPWDQHGDLELGHTQMARQVDQPIAGLIKDLKARGLLESTLVIWAGEFGRTPFTQGSNGRDHNPYGFSIWLAGGGIRGGTIFGRTDEYGYHTVENPRTFYDLWATVLYLLGVDHVALTYRYGGRDFRLTDVHGNVMHEILT
jgi:membrane-anchored protein YejM (alkaline phosphatase superfamily)